MKEFEIRPKKLFNEYLEISRKDIERFFHDYNKFVEIACPACECKKSNFAFEKSKFSYRVCSECLTLFTSPRPTEEMINNFYRDSASGKFWAERFFPETAEARRKMIFRPRAELLAQVLEGVKLPKPVALADVGSGFGIFLEEVKKTGIFDEVIGIEPSVDLADCCRKKGFKVIEKGIEEIGEKEIQVSAACSFEVLEHLFDPAKFVRGMGKILQPGGIMLFTTLTISGLDLQVLWDRSKSISPPHHINFLSTEGLRKLIARCGFEEIEISTPGKLDVDIIRNTTLEMPDIKVPRFMEYVIKHRGRKTAEALQKYLQENQLSSHARVIARKKQVDNSA